MAGTATVMRCLCCVNVLVLLGVSFVTHAANSIMRDETQITCKRPSYVDHAEMARYVVHLNTWGSVASSSIHLGGLPFAAVESYSDGPLGNSTGRLMFFLTSLDATGADVQVNKNVTLSLAEIQIPDSCQQTDPEDPTCAKVSISGLMSPVDQEGLQEAERILFSRHPVMKSWPVGHHFVLYELHVSHIRLLDYYGGAADITSGDYQNANILCSPTSDMHTTVYKPYTK